MAWGARHVGRRRVRVGPHGARAAVVVAARHDQHEPDAGRRPRLARCGGEPRDCRDRHRSRDGRGPRTRGPAGSRLVVRRTGPAHDRQPRARAVRIVARRRADRARAGAARLGRAASRGVRSNCAHRSGIRPESSVRRATAIHRDVVSHPGGTHGLRARGDRPRSRGAGRRLRQHDAQLLHPWLRYPDARTGRRSADADRAGVHVLFHRISPAISRR